MQLPETNFRVLIFGLVAIFILAAGNKLIPGRPLAILLVVVSIILMMTTPLSGAGFSLTGNIPRGLPWLHFPSIRWKDLQEVIPLAFASFLLAYIESVSAARTLASQGGYEIDTRQELLALAFANAAVAMGQSYPVTGGLSQSAVNSKAGAKTSLSLILASVTIGLCLIFLTGPMKYLPNVMLAAILLVAIGGLVDVKGMIAFVESKPGRVHSCHDFAYWSDCPGNTQGCCTGSGCLHYIAAQGSLSSPRGFPGTDSGHNHDIPISAVIPTMKPLPDC